MKLGDIALYRTDGRNGLAYDLPAVVTCTAESHPGDYPDGSPNPLPVPDEGCVHLTVFTPGGYGTTLRDKIPEDDTAFTRAWNDKAPMTPGSGTYVEWNVPIVAALPGEPVPPRTIRKLG